MSKRPMTTKQASEALARAHTDMGTFAAIQAILEGGVISVDSQSDEFKLTNLVKGAQRRAFARYEKAEAILATKPE